MNRTANLYVVAAPSGSGKTSLVKALVQTINNVCISVSYTTRSARPGEVDGIDYNFVDAHQFQEMVKEGQFLEYAMVHGNYYGTSKTWIYRQLENNNDVILEIDWQGARSIHQQFPHAVLIFILPPSRELLQQRLIARNQDHDNVIKQRLSAAREEIRHYQEFNYLILNDTFEHALQDLTHIVLAERLHTAIQERKLAPILEDWLKKQ